MSWKDFLKLMNFYEINSNYAHETRTRQRRQTYQRENRLSNADWLIIFILSEKG